jgi:hypothetical protein
MHVPCLHFMLDYLPLMCTPFLTILSLGKHVPSRFQSLPIVYLDPRYFSWQSDVFSLLPKCVHFLGLILGQQEVSLISEYPQMLQSPFLPSSNIKKVIFEYSKLSSLPLPTVSKICLLKSRFIPAICCSPS